MATDRAERDRAELEERERQAEIEHRRRRFSALVRELIRETIRERLEAIRGGRGRW